MNGDFLRSVLALADNVVYLDLLDQFFEKHRCQFVHFKETADGSCKLFLFVPHMYDWRGEEGNATLNNFMNWLRELVPIFDSESNDYTTIKNFGFNDTIIEEIKHASSLKFYEQLLDNKEGMKKIYDAYAQQLTVIFLLDRDASLFTSDNPAFELIDEDGLKKPILAITPKVLMMLARKDPEKPLSYMINRLSPKEVEYFNKQIFNHGNMIVSKRPITDSDIEKYK